MLQYSAKIFFKNIKQINKNIVFWGFTLNSPSFMSTRAILIINKIEI
jgi:hypothetical protein